MKVLFIENAGLYSAGAYRSLVALIVELRKLDVECYVALPKSADAVDLLIDEHIPYIQMQSCSYTSMIKDKESIINKIKMPIKDVVVKCSAFKLAKYILDNGIDIVHDNTSVSYIGYYAAKIAHVKHVWHFREFMEEDFNCHYWRRKHAIKMFCDSDINIAVSNSLFNKYKSIISNMVVVYNGIDVNKYYANRTGLFANPEIKVICVGRVCDGKGQKKVVEAMCALRRKYGENIKLSLAGTYTNEEYRKIMSVAKLGGVNDSVEFLGQCNSMESVYPQYDVICMASNKEAFGRVTVEAMLAGCLALGADSGGTSEILTENTGIKFVATSVEDLTEKLHFIINNRPLVAKIALNGQRDVKERFSSSRNAKEIKNIYEKILNRQ